MTTRSDTLQGSLPLLVLTVLHRRGPLHGYAITTHIETLSDALRVEEGSLYPLAVDHRRGEPRAQARLGAAMSWLSGMANVFRPGGVDRGLDEEMTHHMESRIADLVASGMTRETAEAEARRQFGNLRAARVDPVVALRNE